MHQDFLRGIPQHTDGPGKGACEFPRGRIVGMSLDEFRDDCKEHLQPCAMVHEDFASEEIHGLNAVRAFVERDNARVTKMLLDLVFHDIAMPTKDLHGQAGAFDGEVAAECLNDRCHQGG
ncbi:hypothetical protein D3C72_1520110 [compost metagenome]